MCILNFILNFRVNLKNNNIERDSNMLKKSGFLLNLVVIIITIYVTPGLMAGIIATDSDGSKMYVSDGKVKHQDHEEGMIMDSQTGEVIYFNSGNKSFTRGKMSDYCNAMSNLMEQMIQSMPPEYKKMLGIGEEKKPPKVTVVSEGSGGSLAGYKTEKYKVMADGQLHEELWLATDDVLMKQFKPLVPLFSEFFKCSKIMEMIVPVEGSPEYSKLLEKGFTLKSIRYENGEQNIETNITDLLLKDISSTEFQPPAGYQELSFTEFFSSQMDQE